MVRSYSFWLPHWEGDQSQYVTLAMKLGHKPGLSGYNLFEVKLLKAGFKTQNSLQYMAPSYVRGVEGDLAEAYKHTGMNYYNHPLFWKGPMLPLVIKWSHDAFVGKDKPYFVLNSNIREAVYKVRPKAVFESQFWLAIIPIFFNLLVAGIIYLLCRCFAGSHASLMATAAFFFFPVSLLCSYRLWNESLAMTFLWLSVLLFWKSRRFLPGAECLKRDRTGVLLLAVSGFSFGFAVLSNQRTLSFLPAILAYGVLCNGTTSLQNIWRKPKLIFNLEFCVFLIPIVLTTFYWFYTATSVYGNPLWMPVETVTLWTKELQARPIAPIVYIVGGIYLCPLLVLGFATFRLFLKECKRLLGGELIESPVIFLWIIGMPLMAYLFILRIDNPEHRYFYPIIPAFIVLAAINLDRFNQWLRTYVQSFTSVAVAQWVLMTVYAYWAFHTAMPVILAQKNLIRIPF